MPFQVGGTSVVASHCEHGATTLRRKCATGKKNIPSIIAAIELFVATKKVQSNFESGTIQISRLSARKNTVKKLPRIVLSLKSFLRCKLSLDCAKHHEAQRIFHLPSLRDELEFAHSKTSKFCVPSTSYSIRASGGCRGFSSSAHTRDRSGMYVHSVRLLLALGCFKEAIQHDVQFAAAHNNLALVLLSHGKVYEAAVEFRTAGTLDPNALAPSTNLHSLYQRLGWHREAASAMSELDARETPNQ